MRGGSPAPQGTCDRGAGDEVASAGVATEEGVGRAAPLARADVDRRSRDQFAEDRPVAHREDSWSARAGFRQPFRNQADDFGKEDGVGLIRFQLREQVFQVRKPRLSTLVEEGGLVAVEVAAEAGWRTPAAQLVPAVIHEVPMRRRAPAAQRALRRWSRRHDPEPAFVVESAGLKTLGNHRFPTGETLPPIREPQGILVAGKAEAERIEVDQTAGDSVAVVLDRVVEGDPAETLVAPETDSLLLQAAPAGEEGFEDAGRVEVSHEPEADARAGPQRDVAPAGEAELLVEAVNRARSCRTR